MLANTAGELEPERRSRRASLLEAFGVMCLLLIALWWVAYPLGVLLEIPAASVASRGLVAALLAFAALVSPRWHGDSLKSWGLGNPRELLRLFQSSSGSKRVGLALLLAGASALVTAELYRSATGGKRFVLGIEPATTLKLQAHLGGEAVVFVICLGFGLLWTAWIIRYDNLWPALRAAGLILALLLPLTLLIGWAVNGSAVFLQARPPVLLRNGLDYIFWGAVQQAIFCSYFGTRLRKGFAPGRSPSTRAWKRPGVAMLNGVFFGLVHMDNWLLVGFAWVLGSVLSWFFMEDRYRNLQALGLVHGVLGACVLWLFGPNGAPVRLYLRAGPWAMPHRADWPMLLIAGVIILGFALALAAVARLSRQDV